MTKEIRAFGNPHVFLRTKPVEDGSSIGRALADHLKQPQERVGGPLLMGAVLEPLASDRIRIFDEKFGFDPHKRPY